MKKLVALLLAVMMLSTMVAFADETTEHANSLIYGASTMIQGDWGRACWTNNATDDMIQSMIDDYDTVALNQGGAYIINETIVKEYTATANEDGTKTYTITINDGLLYNDGTEITVEDYVAWTLFHATATAAEMGSTASGYMKIVGGEEYKAGEAATLTGLRLLGNNTFSVTIKADYLPYYYDISYASFEPAKISYWFGEGVGIADDGEGCYFTGFDSESVKAAVEVARFASDNRVSAGPYTLESYDAGSNQAVLKINPYYAGNFEGQKPSIETIVIVKAEDETWADAMKTGEIELYDTITDGSHINTAMDMIDNGGAFSYCQFDRPGYGKIVFQSDFGPTQFVAVRQAIAMMLDRNEFANSFCQGWGSVVNGPYGTAMWMFQDSEEYFDEVLNTYDYDAEGAVALLIEDGWVYAEDGSDYVEGVRYKKVTDEEAGEYTHIVTLADGTKLMALQIDWASSEGNSVSDLLAVMLAQNPDVAAAGMVINQSIMTFAELYNYLCRDGSQGDKYAIPTYGMFNLATNYSPIYDQSYSFTLDPELLALGYNTDRILDEQLDELSMNMVYGVDSSDSETYLKTWQEFIVRWNELLPELPLYSNVYITFYADFLENYEQTSYWNFEQAIVYANVKGY